VIGFAPVASLVGCAPAAFLTDFAPAAFPICRVSAALGKQCNTIT